MILELAPRPAISALGLDPLEAIQHQEVRLAPAQRGLEPLEPPAGALARVAREIRARFAQERIRVWVLVERPYENAAAARVRQRIPEEMLRDRSLPCPTDGHERDHPIGRRGIIPPRAEAYKQSLAPLEVRRWLERMLNPGHP